MSLKEEKERSAAFYAVIVGVLIAAIPASLGYLYSFVDGIRKDELAFTKDQVGKLYGPLHALAQANDASWKQFVATGQAPHWDNPTEEQITLWRIWMPKVLQPMNTEAENIIVANAQLIAGNELPGAFRKLIAHTEAYKALMSTWQPEDIKNPSGYKSKAANTVDLQYPNDFDKCVGPIYKALRKRQESLQTSIFPFFSMEALPNPGECN